MAVKEITYNNATYEIYYDIKNPDKNRDIVFLHGWGSNKELMKQAFGSYFKDFRHIYIDMPGFGKSPNEEILTTFDYKEIVELFLQTLSSKKDVIVGHSFGGKVAILLNPKKLVLLSSAGIKTEKSFKVKVKIALFKTLKPLGLGKFYKLFASKDVEGMKQNMYETFKNVVDENFEDIFKSFDSPTLILWGKEDSATPLSSGKKMASLIKNSTFYEFEGDHYFFLKEPKKVSEKIEEFIKGWRGLDGL